jgi:hypothetical protein
MEVVTDEERRKSADATLYAELREIVAAVFSSSLRGAGSVVRPDGPSAKIAKRFK